MKQVKIWPLPFAWALCYNSSLGLPFSLVPKKTAQLRGFHAAPYRLLEVRFETLDIRIKPKTSIPSLQAMESFNGDISSTDNGHFFIDQDKIHTFDKK